MIEVRASQVLRQFGIDHHRLFVSRSYCYTHYRRAARGHTRLDLIDDEGRTTHTPYYFRSERQLNGHQLWVYYIHESDIPRDMVSEEADLCDLK